MAPIVTHPPARSFLPAAVTLGLAACQATGPGPVPASGAQSLAGPVEQVVGGPRFYTGDRAAPWADWVGLDAEGRVSEVGRGPRTLDVRLEGALAVPALADHHVHLGLLGRAVETADLREDDGPEEIVAAVRDHAQVQRDAGVVAGFGWKFEEALRPDFRGVELLAGVDWRGRPIALTRQDGHALWVDAVALQWLEARGLLGDLGGQRVLRRADGAPTGVIVDPTLATWEALRDEGGGRAAQRIARGLERLAAEGLAEVHAMATPCGDLGALVAARAMLGPEAPRIIVWLENTEEARLFLEQHPGGSVRVGDGVVVRGLKLFADGALGSRGAAMHAPYADAPETRGRCEDATALAADARRAISAGHAVAIHAIGDRGVRVALEALEAAGAKRGQGHRLEHAQVTTPEDRGRMERLGVTASMQPLHALSDAPWAAERLGPERLEGAYAARQMLVDGVPLVFGSDAPLDAPGLLDGLRAAVLKEGRGRGEKPPRWLMRQAVTLEEALQAYAASHHPEAPPACRGRLQPGCPFEVSRFAVKTPGEVSLEVLLGGATPLGISRGGPGGVMVSERP
jgi:predicted amidohydrolase YtcJ